ncbi:MAG: rhomboid family intramembrane serine protease [Bacteroidetes bacterium]|nr:rhomboid family intramembrane serine protease [Bacteroidota bacterium]
MREFRQTRFEILPPVIKNLVIINGLIYLAQTVLGDAVQTKIFDIFALHTWQSPLFKPWQFFTYMFLHGSFWHIFFNMYALWLFGSVLENLWGPKRFLIFYFVCGLGAALCHMLVLYHDMQPVAELFKSLPFEQQLQLLNNPNFKLNEPTLGASGAVFGCLAAFGYLFPNALMYIIFIPVPIKAKWIVIGYIAIEIFLALKNSAGDDVAHVAHIGGAFFGLALVYFWNKTNKRKFY